MTALKQAIDLVQKAMEADQNQEFKGALEYYELATVYFRNALSETHPGKKRDLVESQVAECSDKVKHLKKKTRTIATDGAESSIKYKSKSGGGAGKDSDIDDEGQDKKKLEGQLSGAIVSEKPNIRWTDVAGLELAKEALLDCVTLPVKLPQFFQTEHRKPWKGILLYGPPGTGKTYLAKAVATEADSTFISVSSSDLVSKYLGESARLVRQLFEMAQENKPSVIFIDEVDSLCSARGLGKGSEAADRIKTEFFVQMDGVGKNSDGVLVLGATNIPWALDSAIRRRFERRIYIPPPEAEARKLMFDQKLKHFPHELSKEDIVDMSTKTEGYSGADIALVVNAALMEPLKRIKRATHFKVVSGPDPYNPDKTREDLLSPCSPGDQGAIEMKWTDLEDGKVFDEPVTKRDFKEALASTRPTVNATDLQQYEEWTSEFGQEG